MIGFQLPGRVVFKVSRIVKVIAVTRASNIVRFRV